MGRNKFKTAVPTALVLSGGVYRSFGYKLPRTSSGPQKSGRKVSYKNKSSLEILICYSGHVAMYIGNGKIVHASTRKNRD